MAERKPRRRENGNVPARLNEASMEYVEPRCKVCQSPFRKEIELLLLKGMGYSSIERFCKNFHDKSSGKAPINRKNLATHASHHMNLAQSALRKVIDERFREEAISAEDMKDSILTHRAIMEGMLQKAWDQIVTKDSRFAWTEVLQLMDRIERMDAQYASVQVDELMKEARAFSQAVQQVVPQAMWNEIAQAFDENMERSKSHSMVPELEPVVDGEVVD